MARSKSVIFRAPHRGTLIDAGHHADPPMVPLDERPENGLDFSVVGKRRRRGRTSVGNQANGQAKEMEKLPGSQNRIGWAHKAVVCGS